MTVTNYRLQAQHNADSLQQPLPDAPVDTSTTYQNGDGSAALADTMSTPVDTAVKSSPRWIASDTLNRVKKDKGFYYQSWLDSALRAEKVAMQAPRKQPRLPNLDIFFTIFKIMLWLMAIAVLGFVVFKLFLGKNALFLHSRQNVDAVIDNQEQAAPGDYSLLIERAVTAQDFRLAIRYYYLQCLQQLAGSQYIQLMADKTNYQYIQEVRKRSAGIATMFANLTRKYEYVWYGEYAVNAVLYTTLESDFKQLETAIHSN